MLQLQLQPHGACTCVMSCWPVRSASTVLVYPLYTVYALINALACAVAYGDFWAVRNLVLVTELVTRSGASNSSY